MAHLNGADERGARKAEEDLWMRFVRDGIADQVTALRYLQMLKNRPDDRLPAMDAVHDCRRASFTHRGNA